MGRFVLSLVLISLYVCLTAQETQAQYTLIISSAAVEPDTTLLTQIEAGFETSDSAVLLSLAADPIDIALFGQGATYSRSQATRVLQEFFRRHPPEYVMLREEVAADDRRSLVGEYLEVGSTQPAAVFVRLRARGTQWEIRSIRIE